MAGQCYKAAYSAQLNTLDAVLVHGIVTPLAGELKGKSYGHAWIELKSKHDVEVIDPSLPIGRQRHSKETYYLLGGINYTKKYTLDETVDIVLKFKNYGPWDSKITAALHLGD